MEKISIPPTFSELEALGDENLNKLVRMAKAVLNERGPVLQQMSHSHAQQTSHLDAQPVAQSNTRPAVRSSKIDSAFENIPATPVDAEEYAASHDISVNTLRQQKRFDRLRDEGFDRVYIKKGRDGRLYVWRGANRGIDQIGVD